MAWKPKFALKQEVIATKAVLTGAGEIVKGDRGYVVSYHQQKKWYTVYWYRKYTESNIEESFIKKT